MNKPVPIFPLPNHVVLPFINMPYRLFEDRYRALGKYVSEHQQDGLFIPCLQAGWESDYEGEPAYHAHAMLCEIQGIQEAPNGEFALMVLGKQRYQLSEAESDSPFRFAHATLDEINPDMSEAALQQSLLTLAPEFHQHMQQQGVQGDQLKQFIDTCQHAEELLNRMAHLLFSDPVIRQQFIDCANISDQLALVRIALGHRSSDDVSMN